MIREHVPGVTSGVRLDDDEILARAKRQRRLAQHAREVDAETARLTARADWLTRKASRLRAGSNGRHAAVRDAQICIALAELLRVALAGNPVPKFHPPAANRQVERATHLLHQLQAV